MNWYLIIGLILLAWLVLVGLACCKVGGDSENRSEIQHDEHEQGLTL